MAEIRTIEYTITEQLTLTPTATQEAGVQGDDRATAVRFQLPAQLVTGYTLRLMMEDGRGGVDVTDALTVKHAGDVYYVEYILPLSWTQHGGEIAVRLMAYAVTDGTITQTAHSFEGRLRFRDKTTFVQKVGTQLEDTLAQVLEGIDEAQTAASNAIAACSGAQAAAEEAAGSATSAANATVAAGASKTAAQEAQTSAEGAAASAAAKATAAEKSAAAADSAKTAAENAKTAAAGSAGAAASSATAAAASAESAAAGAAAAETAKTDAESAKGNAAAAAENAAASASAAAGSKTAAETAADEAESAAATASAKAAEAVAAAAAGKMQLIRQITTTEEVQTLSLNKDNGDAAFSCDKVFLIVQFPAAIKLGTGGQTFYITETTGKIRYLYYAGTAHTTLILRMTAEVLGAESDAALGMTQIAFSQYDWSEDSINFGRTASGLTAIKSLVVGFEGSYKIPVGTIIKLYGRRA